MWRWLRSRPRGPGAGGLQTSLTRSLGGAGAGDKVTRLVFQRLDLETFLGQMESNKADTPAFGEILHLYRFERKFPDLSNFRLGPNMFDKIPLDWILLIDASSGEGKSRLLAHGVATRVSWSGDATGLPSGWQGAVRKSYLDSVVERVTCNTLVGLFINVEPQFRERGLAAVVVDAMKTIRSDQALAHFVIPLRLPQHYKRENAELSMAQFSALRREDGRPVDHWLRLHLQLGAQIVTTSEISHQHAMNGRDFAEQFGSRFESTGYHLVEKNGEWFRAYVDVDRDFVLVNQGCVWVQYPSC